MNSKLCSILLIVAFLKGSQCAVLNSATPARKLVVTTSQTSSNLPDRKLEFFKSDEKTREVIKLRKEIANSEGLVKQYEGSTK